MTTITMMRKRFIYRAYYYDDDDDGGKSPGIARNFARRRYTQSLYTFFFLLIVLSYAHNARRLSRRALNVPAYNTL